MSESLESPIKSGNPLPKQEPLSSPILVSGPNHFGLDDDDDDDVAESELGKVAASNHSSADKEKVEDNGEEYVVGEVVDSAWEHDMEVQHLISH